MNLRLLPFIICWFPFIPIHAQTCCSGGIPLSNSIGLAPLEQGSFQLNINYDYNNLNTLNNGSKKLDDNSRLRITHSVLLNFGYSITNNLSVESLFTWINQRRNISQFENENLDETSGIGDGLLLLKYNFPNLIGEQSQLSVGLGTKFPLGSSEKKNEQGIILNADLQPGSNTWDLIYWSSISKNFDFRPTLTFSSRIIYRSTGKNNSYLGDSTYKFGNELQTSLGASDQFFIFNTLLNPSLFFKYRQVSKDEINNFNLENTGGEWVFIIPNFSINLTPTIAFSNKVEIPIYSYVDGTQLTPTFRFTSGVLFKITPKSKTTILN